MVPTQLMIDNFPMFPPWQLLLFKSSSSLPSSSLANWARPCQADQCFHFWFIHFSQKGCEEQWTRTCSISLTFHLGLEIPSSRSKVFQQLINLTHKPAAFLQPKFPTAPSGYCSLLFHSQLDWKPPIIILLLFLSAETSIYNFHFFGQKHFPLYTVFSSPFPVFMALL